MFDGCGDRRRLVERHRPVPVDNVVWQWEVGNQPVGEFGVSLHRLLMNEHAWRLWGERRVGDRRGESGPGRRSLPSELGDESRCVLPIGGVVPLVPQVPDVHRAILRVVRVPGAVGRERAPRSVADVRRKLRDDRREKVVVVTGTPRLPLEPQLPVPLLVAP